MFFLDNQIDLSNYIFTYGDFNGPNFSDLILENDNNLKGYQHYNEKKWEVKDNKLCFLNNKNEVSSIFKIISTNPLILVGNPLNSNYILLYLVEKFCFKSLKINNNSKFSPVLINSVPKSGTYLLRNCFKEMSFTPTDLHFGNGHVDDNRNFKDEKGIHFEPWRRRSFLPTELVINKLPKQSVSVSHFDELDNIKSQNIVLINVVRDMKSIIKSLFQFKYFKVGTNFDGSENFPNWRNEINLTDMFTQFTLNYANDIKHIKNQLNIFYENKEDCITLRYEDVINLNINEIESKKINSSFNDNLFTDNLLGSIKNNLFKKTSTLRTNSQSFEKDDQIILEELILTFLKKENLLELNKKFGY